MRGAILGAAFVLAGLSAGAAIRALTWTPPPPELPILAADVGRARALVVRLARGLISLQKTDGSFDRAPGDQDFDPEVKQNAATALACAALARARSLGIAVEGLEEALGKAIDLLKARQAAARGGGTFGSISADHQADPRPSLEATSAGVMALAIARRPEDEASLRQASAAYVRATTYGGFKGWPRALAALAADALVREGRSELLTRPLAALVHETATDADRIDCGDFRLAEAISRRIRAPGAGGGLGVDILASCLLDPDRPRWTGESSDLQSWYMQAWLAARLPGGKAWFPRVLPALEEGMEPLGRLPGGVYADPVTQNACAVLALAEGLEVPRT